MSGRKCDDVLAALELISSRKLATVTALPDSVYLCSSWTSTDDVFGAPELLFARKLAADTALPDFV